MMMRKTSRVSKISRTSLVLKMKLQNRLLFRNCFSLTYRQRWAALKISPLAPLASWASCRSGTTSRNRLANGCRRRSVRTCLRACLRGRICGDAAWCLEWAPLASCISNSLMSAKARIWGEIEENWAWVDYK